jgi:hypothetical protein
LFVSMGGAFDRDVSPAGKLRPMNVRNHDAKMVNPRALDTTSSSRWCLSCVFAQSAVGAQASACGANGHLARCWKLVCPKVWDTTARVPPPAKSRQAPSTIAPEFSLRPLLLSLTLHLHQPFRRHQW